MTMHRREFLETAAMAAGGLLASTVPIGAGTGASGRFLYVATPGIRNYVEYGGIGILVFDMDHDHRFVRRIPTFAVPAGEAPENVKGIAASATDASCLRDDTQAAGVLRPGDRQDGVEPRVSRRLRPAGDRARRPPSLCAVVRGTALARVERRHRRRDHDHRHQFRRAQHDLRAGRPARLPRGPEVADADRSPTASDPQGRRARSGRSATSIRPFTINGEQTLCFVNVNELLGFEVGDMKSGQDAAPGRGHGLREGAGQAARLPQPRRRPDARREGALAVGRPQQPAAHLRCDRRCRPGRSPQSSFAINPAG